MNRRSEYLLGIFLFFFILFICFIIELSPINTEISELNNSSTAIQRLDPTKYQIQDEELDPGYKKYMEDIQKTENNTSQPDNGNALGGLPNRYPPHVKDVELFGTYNSKNNST